MKKLTPLLVLVALIASSAFLEHAANGYVQRILLYVLVNIILACSLNIVSGFTGQFSMGHAGFAAIGGYLAAWMSLQPWGNDFLQSLQGMDFLAFFGFSICGGLLAGLFGLIVGVPSLRLRGDYLAIVTLGFGEIIRVILLNTPAVGGALGLSRLATPSGFSIGPLGFSSFQALFIYISIWVVIACTVFWRLTRSSFGKIFQSVREDELAAQAMGVSTTRVKVSAFVLSSFFAGIAGSLSALAVGGLNPSTAAFARSVDIIIMVVLGGLGSLSGSIFAAIIITILPEFVLRPLQDQTGVDLRMVIYAFLLIVFMIARPKGLFGARELIDILRQRRADLQGRPQ